MKKLALVFAMLMPMAACGGGGAGEVLGKMKEAKNKVCACKDKACADKAKDDFEAWMMKNMDKLKNVKPTKAQDEEADKLDSEMEKCAAKFDKADDAAPEAPAAE